MIIVNDTKEIKKKSQKPKGWQRTEPWEETTKEDETTENNARNNI